MSEPYTPTTDEVADVWASRYDGEHTGASGAERRGYEAEFDRWLDQVKAAARREGQAEAWDEGWVSRHNYDERGGEAPTPNPYQYESEEDRHVDQ